MLLFQPSAFISTWRALRSLCGCSTKVMVQRHATRNVLQRFYACSAATAWAKDSLCCADTAVTAPQTSQKPDVPEVCEGQNPRVSAVCMDRGFTILFCLFFIFIFPQHQVARTVPPQNTGERTSDEHLRPSTTMSASGMHALPRASFTRS